MLKIENKRLEMLKTNSSFTLANIAGHVGVTGWFHRIAIYSFPYFYPLIVDTHSNKIYDFTSINIVKQECTPTFY